MSDGQSPYNATAAYDVVGIFDADFNQLFADARPLKLTLNESNTLMKHPVESGYKITDHRVINEIKISLQLILTPDTYVDTYNQIKAVALGVDTVNVQTNTGFYENMFISTYSHKEDPTHFDTIVLTLGLEEIIIVQAATSPLPDTPKNSGNKNTKAATTTETTTGTTKAKSSALYDIFES